MAEQTIHLVTSEAGDWTALYIDGQKVIENHSLNPHEVLEALGLPFTRLVADEEAMGWVFPDRVENLETV